MKRLMLAVALVACACRRDMAVRPERRPLGSSDFFPDRSASRPQLPDTIARNRGAMGEVRVERGRERYEIYCAPCHGQDGSGNGVIVRHGFPRPPAFATLSLTTAGIVEAIRNGKGTMYGYADRVPESDRWSIAAYVEELRTGRAR